MFTGLKYPSSLGKKAQCCSLVGSLRMSEQKRALLTGWCNETVNTRLNSLKRVPHAGDWRRSTVVRVQVKTATVTWPYYNK